MEMSPAAEPPRQPPIAETDRKHPLFPAYERYRFWMTAQLVECASFPDWLRSREREAITTAAQAHPRYPEFLAWMKVTKGGLRRCPAGVFPQNFRYWLDGGRW